MSEPAAPDAPVSRRDRLRAATIDEIKAAALQLMKEQGTTDFKFSDVARLLGMTPPALYRYFADRDELITALIADAYRDLGEAAAAARDAVTAADIGGRLLAVARSYREWARREPQRFALIFGVPVPGYAAPEEGPTTEAARRAMAQLSAVFAEAAQCQCLDKPLVQEVGAALRHFAKEHAKEPHEDVIEPVESFQAMLHVWSALHGFTCLEAYGHLDWLSPEAREDLFVAQVRLAATAAGLPVPK